MDSKVFLVWVEHRVGDQLSIGCQPDGWSRLARNGKILRWRDAILGCYGKLAPEGPFDGDLETVTINIPRQPDAVKLTRRGEALRCGRRV